MAKTDLLWIIGLLTLSLIVALYLTHGYQHLKVNEPQKPASTPKPPERKKECMEAFKDLNIIRRQYNREPLQWDDRLYALAVFRCRDMYEKKYYDHVTPEGKCVKDFKEGYNLSEYTIAENIGEMLHSPEGIPKEDTTPREVIDDWMNSRGHKYNMLYPSHVLGAVGCYYATCVFLGANTNPHGLGSSPCTPGEDTTAFWRNASKQPDEVLPSTP
ncbi:MAG: CAP domain-containing protein [Candidatus Altiarchaeota archaeon]|nr:CAP domain-containing protein [Candidatus Altiarchaeota archaeon]